MRASPGRGPDGLRAVFASRNPHKLEQVRLLLPGVELVPIDDVAPGTPLPEEHDSFEANALSKARAACAATGMTAIADDSGLEVAALGGAPGVVSALYAGEGASDAQNNARLVSELRALEGEPDLSCTYRCVAVLVTPDGRELVAHGRLDGHVVLEGRGTQGFGYDPHVVPVGETRTMGEIPLEEKIRFNHRARAFGELARLIRTRL